MNAFIEWLMIAVICGALAALTACMASDAGQCKPHTFQLGC